MSLGAERESKPTTISSAMSRKVSSEAAVRPPSLCDRAHRPWTEHTTLNDVNVPCRDVVEPGMERCRRLIGTDPEKLFSADVSPEGGTSCGTSVSDDYTRRHQRERACG